MPENYYSILGVNENSSKEEIKKAYRNLQLKYHPDKNNNSQESNDMTQKINEAYDVLSDPVKKSEYDMMRNFSNNPGGGNPFTRMNATGGMDIPMDDIFNMFFNDLGANINGFGRMPPNAKIHIFHGPGGIHTSGIFPGANIFPDMNRPLNFNKPIPIIKTVQVNMEQVLNGVSVPLEIERWIIENGNKVFEKETIYFDLPAGADDGEMIILREKGNVVNEICKGDIKINIKVVNNTIFKRSGLDLILEKNITLKEALCGLSFDINYINGKNYTLNNNKGNIIRPEYQKVYSGMGLKRGERTGNLIIHFHVIFPETLSEEQIDKLSKIL